MNTIKFNFLFFSTLPSVLAKEQITGETHYQSYGSCMFFISLWNRDSSPAVSDKD